VHTHLEPPFEGTFAKDTLETGTRVRQPLAVLADGPRCHGLPAYGLRCPRLPAAVRQDRGGLTVTYTRDPRVDAYIDALRDWQQRICREVRDIAHQADAEVEETIKRTVQPYFVLQGNVAALLAAKDHVNVFLYDPTVADPGGIITHGHHNATGRQISIRQGESLNRPALLAIFREIVTHNRAGGWRKIQSRM
jgi:hypothetical protein